MDWLYWAEPEPRTQGAHESRRRQRLLCHASLLLGQLMRIDSNPRAQLREERIGPYSGR